MTAIAPTSATQGHLLASGDIHNDPSNQLAGNLNETHEFVPLSSAQIVNASLGVSSTEIPETEATNSDPSTDAAQYPLPPSRSSSENQFHASLATSNDYSRPTFSIQRDQASLTALFTGTQEAPGSEGETSMEAALYGLPSSRASLKSNSKPSHEAWNHASRGASSIRRDEALLTGLLERGQRLDMQRAETSTQAARYLRTVSDVIVTNEGSGSEEYLSQYLQEAENLSGALPYLTCLTVVSRNERSGSCVWYDYKGSTLLKFDGFGPERNKGDRRAFVYLDDLNVVRSRLRSVEDEVDTRLIVVEDLTRQMIDLLGSLFSIPHEFFAQHLHNSGYVSGNYSEQDPDSWITSNAQKDYVSLKWHRPVMSRANAPARKDVAQLLNTEGSGIRWRETRGVRSRKRMHTVELRHEMLATSNIMRDSIEIVSDPGQVERPRAWEEKITVWRKKYPRVMVIVLLDPLPNVEETCSGPPRADECAFSIGGENSPSWLREKNKVHSTSSSSASNSSVTGSSVSSDFHHNLNTNHRIYNPFFHLMHLRGPQISPFLGIVRGNVPGYLELATESTERSLDQWLTAEAPRHTRAPIMEAIFRIANNDIVKLLQIIRKTLREIDRDTLDDALLQDRLTHWRLVMNKCRYLLADMQMSISDFFSFNLFLSEGDREMLSRRKKLEQDINEALTLLGDTYKTLLTNISIIDSKRGIAEAEAVTRLTELAFIFIPLTFSAALFSVPIPEIASGATIQRFVGVAIAILIFIYGIRLAIRSDTAKTISQTITSEIRSFADLPVTKPLPTTTVVAWTWARGVPLAVSLAIVLGGSATALGFLWTHSSNTAFHVITTVYVLLILITIGSFLLSYEWIRDRLRLHKTPKFLENVQQSRRSRNPHLKSLRLRLLNNFSSVWRNLRKTGAKIGIEFALTFFVIMAPVIALLSRKIDLTYKLGLMVLTVFIAMTDKLINKSL